ncbi:hypothetical protein BDN71DRAFT_1279056 [Pleurotus eryngii]|uniref:DUF5648 domain-containing protein n=1 Tax=Pleurotus eryngii TaxID=5323 RepID=A0A9P5ZQV5_PLEER|nr:hypothetical protein BDN71DRAFT_1279056 [Pleurotus eryngii]
MEQRLFATLLTHGTDVTPRLLDQIHEVAVSRRWVINDGEVTTFRSARYLTRVGYLLALNSTMKFSLALIASLFLAAQAATLPPDSERTNTDPCPPPHTEVPFLRAFSPARVDHFYTTSQREWEDASHHGYTPEGPAGFVFPAPAPSTVPLYRLFHAVRKDHFYTTNEAEAIRATAVGWNRQGVAGYVFDRQICGSQPLFRLYNPGNVDHFYTTSPAERDNFLRSGLYSDEGVAGFVIV